MSGPIAFRFDDEKVEAEYQQYRDSLEGDPSKSDVARELIDAGLAARHRDVYDHVGADEELREAVEEARNVEETDAEAIRRLLREGTDATADRSLRYRIEEAVGLGLVSAFPLAISQLYGVGSGYLFVAALLLAVFFEERIPEVSAWVRSLVRA